ncbi:prostaglandin F synthase 2-like isoform X2 [Periplaneta americana]
MYQNEEAIGKTLKKWFDSGKLKREDIFIVTKLPGKGNHAESVEKYLKRSLEAFQLDYVDLYLIQGPIGLEDIGEEFLPKNEKGQWVVDYSTDLVGIWKAMEAQVDAGRARSIGLSNFNSRQIAKIVKAARIRPVYLQLELNVYFQQRELVAFCKALDIAVCAYAPLGSPGMNVKLKSLDVPVTENPDLMKDPVVCKVAKQHNKTPAQILLRHCIQRDIIVIPKSVKPDRIKENLQIFDFELTKEEVEELNSLDKRQAGRRFHLDTISWVVSHPEYPFSDPY